MEWFRGELPPTFQSNSATLDCTGGDAAAGEHSRWRFYIAMRRDLHASLPQPRHQVLLLHDDRQFVEAVKRLLDQDGRLEVLWVDNAYDAGRVTRDQVPELILLSDHLPDVQVLDVLRRVRDDKTLEGLRVLCLSALGEHEARDLVSSGADEVLPRPCDPALILDAVHRQLGLNPRQEGSSGSPHLN